MTLSHLAKYSMTRNVAWSFCDSWASCLMMPAIKQNCLTFWPLSSRPRYALRIVRLSVRPSVCCVLTCSSSKEGPRILDQQLESKGCWWQVQQVVFWEVVRSKVNVRQPLKPQTQNALYVSTDGRSLEIGRKAAYRVRHRGRVYFYY